MAGTFTPTVLAQGQLPNTKTALYTAPGSTSAYVKFQSYNNTGSTTETVLIHLKTSAGTSKRFIRVVLDGSEYAIEDVHFVLATGDAIEGQSTTASTVDYFITGVVET